MLPLQRYSNSCVNHLSFKDELCLVFILRWNAHDINHNLSTLDIKLYCILNNIKQYKFIFMPISHDLQILYFTSIYINLNILSIYLWLKWSNCWHNILLNKPIWFNFKSELFLLDFHSFNLILIPKKHDLSTLVNCLKKLDRLYVKLLFLKRDGLVKNFIFDSSYYYFGIAHYTVERSHLLMTVVCFYCIQINLI